MISSSLKDPVMQQQQQPAASSLIAHPILPPPPQALVATMLHHHPQATPIPASTILSLAATSPSLPAAAQAGFVTSNRMTDHPRIIDTQSMLTHALARSVPRRPRGEKKPIPNDQKDDRYFERRKRNNLAAKKSRDQRKMREDAIALRASFLEKENAVLRTSVSALREELNSLQSVILRRQLQQKQREMLNQFMMKQQQKQLHCLEILQNLKHKESQEDNDEHKNEIIDLTISKKQEDLEGGEDCSISET